jgi:hypothetical protein
MGTFFQKLKSLFASAGSEVLSAAETAIAEARAFLGREASAAEAALLAQARKDVPGLTAELWAKVQTLALNVTEAAEKAATLATGDQKWTQALAQFVKTVETDGLDGVRLLFSTTVKETLLQEGAVIAKAGLTALATAAIGAAAA